jgi:predicted RNase H-like HicB family nuclease
MSDKLKNSKRRAATLKPQYIERARPIAEQYQMVIWLEAGEYYGRGVELPYVFGDGKTLEECAENTREAFVTAIAGYLQEGRSPPAPPSEEKRDQQVNVRLSSFEKHLLETRAREAGAKGISEYIRATALRNN